ncbi:MAG: hypothetical protein U0103_27845 [Candidatus Obscuribacterales bacterium]
MAEFLVNFPAGQSVSPDPTTGKRISIAWLILATLILLAFWALRPCTSFRLDFALAVGFPQH